MQGCQGIDDDERLNLESLITLILYDMFIIYHHKVTVTYKVMTQVITITSKYFLYLNELQLIIVFWIEMSCGLVGGYNISEEDITSIFRVK
jgi:hypothetical protein